MAQLLLALLAGILFATGLIVSQMVNPAKVLNFLDLTGRWDPTLLIVLGGALLVSVPGFALVERRAKPLFAARFYLPTKSEIDAKLIVGAALFGVGWGISGLCPGPALTALASGLAPVAGFVVTMILGVLAYKALFEWRP